MKLPPQLGRVGPARAAACRCAENLPMIPLGKSTAQVDPATLRQTLASSRQALIEARHADGHWEGFLASSALSTATAAFALETYARALPDSESTRRDHLLQLARRGRRWLIDHQREDGGWGDTVLSFSNISTTALGWAAVSLDNPPPKQEESMRGNQLSATNAALEKAAAWLLRRAGSMEPRPLARAIADRYGQDRTFSVPILTVLALAGKLGAESDSWRHVPQLPFELAACPHRWFQWLRLPVVSYALPALIAIGLVRHRRRPSRVGPLRWLRDRLAPKTLRVLTKIQPASGGFLEATPLTSFVVLSLVGARQAAHPVATAGVHFLENSVRGDGSWPIDTNLATWVTTLSVGALSQAEDVGPSLAGEDRRRIANWLAEQQYRREHPYTHAAPGGWAWTDLSGGVPDADDTPGAMLALDHLRAAADWPEQFAEAAERAAVWLLDLQNRDGGIPTFCRGWGRLPFDRSSPDLTAHALRAWSAWRNEFSQITRRRIDRAAPRAIDFLGRTQRSEGSWIPLWFGNQHSAEEENPTYGTSRVLCAAAELHPQYVARANRRLDLGSAVAWLLATQNVDGGWGGDRQTPSTVEETALAVEALAAILQFRVRKKDQASLELRLDREVVRAAIDRGAAWLVEKTDKGRDFPVSPIGFYFAKLWYYEQSYPLIFTVAALARAVSLRHPQPGSTTKA